MTSRTRPAGQDTTPIVAHVAIERRIFVGDRRAIWRGSRRDVDWIKHFEDKALDRRATSPGEPGESGVSKTRLPLS